MPPPDELAAEEIVVTARKRNESILHAPVILRGVTSKQINNLKVSDIYDFPTILPGLSVGRAPIRSGPNVFLRGLGSGNSAYIDQTVMLTVDGASLTSGPFYQMALFDVRQIELMKGPQALFFGKSTSAGAIAVRSADPTDKWESEIASGYEFNADEVTFQGRVSGPVSDDLGLRIAAYHVSMKGYLFSPDAGGGGTRLPDTNSSGGRLTLKYNSPASDFRANLKIAYAHQIENTWPAEMAQRRCTLGSPQKPTYASDNCRTDQYVGGIPQSLPHNPNLTYTFRNAAAFAAGAPSALFKDGHAYSLYEFAQAALNLDYDILPELTLTSVSAYSGIRTAQAGRFGGVTANRYFDLGGAFSAQEYSEEIRLTSAFKDSWINFMIGGLYNPASNRNQLVLSAPSATLYTDDRTKFTSVTKSAFGQILVTPVRNVELGLGGRFTHVHKYFSSLIALNNYPAALNPLGAGEGIDRLPKSLTDIKQDNFSPEVTIAYRPADTTMIFASYKQGYKGPGFNASVVTPTYNTTVNTVSPFSGEKVKGVEGGIKVSLLQRQLTLELTGYSYVYRGLQVSFVDTLNNQVNIRNGAVATTRGIELAYGIHPAGIRNLSLNGFLGYNHARYRTFPRAPCYSGQSAASGCANGIQDLSGHQMFRAPHWSGQLGMDYKAEVLADHFLALSLNSTFSSSYNVTPEQNPNGVQSAYVTFDASLRFGKNEGAWEVAVLGRNLSNAFILNGGVDDGLITAGVTGDAQVWVGRPRQVMLQITVRPQLF